jgi:hypothetical protein
VTPERRSFLDGLIERFAARGRAVDPAEAFRRTIIPRWSDLLARSRAAVADELASLSPTRRAWLGVFEQEPSLLGPLGRGRDENLHSSALAWLLGREDATGTWLRAAWLRLLGVDAPVEGWSVAREVAVANGCRVDLHLEVPRAWACFVEAKVDAGEREHQLLDYATALRGRAQHEGVTTTLVFLTLDGRAPTDAVDAVRVRYEDVLVAFLPATSQPTPTARFLCLWLASVARDLYRAAGEGPVHAWKPHHRSRTLAVLHRADAGAP